MGRLRHRKPWLSLGVATLAFLVLGCGGKAAELPERAPAEETAVPLPEWAPENPSPEFVRAARVLKPIPQERLHAASEGDLAVQAQMQRYRLTYPATYEFFGTLSDEQIERFLGSKKKQIRIPVRSLTEAQRAALDNWFEVWREALGEDHDHRVTLFKLGAKENLSNVDVGFWALGGHSVHIWFWVVEEDGSTGGSSSSYFAQI